MVQLKYFKKKSMSIIVIGLRRKYTNNGNKNCPVQYSIHLAMTESFDILVCYLEKK